MKKITQFLFLFALMMAFGNTAFAENTECAGTSTEATEGTFTNGYTYSFTTSGTDVTFNFELLDTKVGLVAYLWNRTSGFQENQMSSTTGQGFSYTLTGQSLNTTLTVACKFAFSGGLAVTKDFTYTVGNSCGGVIDTEVPTAFTATKGAVTANSVELLLNATDNSGAVNFTITNGATTLTTSSNSGVEKSYIVTGLTPSTDYTLSVAASDAVGNVAANNPIVISATTTALAEPTTAAPLPTESASKVISVFSDTYTSISGTDFNPNWSQTTAVSTVQIEGNATLKYSNLNYQGTGLGSDINATGMDYLHIDVWTPNETSLSVYPISRSTAEKFVTLLPLNLNEWNSYDIPLTDFTSQGLSVADIFQFKFVGSNGKIVYLDNIYFYNSSSTEDTEAPTAFTATAGTTTSSKITLLLNATDNSGAVTYEINYGDINVTTIGTSAEQKSYTITGLTPSTEYSFSIVTKDAAGNQSANSPIVLPVSTTAQITSIPTIDFETVGQDWSWTIFENGDNAASLAAVLVNANTTGINSSANCFRFTVNTNGQPWAGLWSANIGEFTFAASNCMVKLMVNKNVLTPMTLKFENDDASVACEIQHSNTIINDWEEITYDFTAHIGKTLTKIVLFPDFPSSRNGVGSINYMDNISFNSNVPVGLAKSSVEGISLYPNPVKDQMQIKSQYNISQVVIHNLLGQIVKVKTVNALETSIDLSQVPAGNYFVTIKDINGKVSIQKMIKL